jgi:glycosyltransferase involved in cell wall biosynthesis
MNPIKVLLASANYPNNYHLWGPWNKEANESIAKNNFISAETLAPLPYTLPLKFFPYSELSKIPLVENGPEGKIHHPRFLYLMPKAIFYKYEGFLYRKSIERYSKNLQTPDIVHCHHVYPDGYGFINLCKKWNVPLVVDIHRSNLFTEYLNNKNLASKVLETFEFASKIICISQEIKNFAIDHGIDEKKLRYNPLGIDINKFRPRESELIKERLLINGKKVILFVGQLIKRKGIENLIKAISLLPHEIKKELKVIIIGDGEDKTNLENLCKKLDLNGLFEFKGTIPRDEISLYYSISDIFVLTSFSEGRPVVIYEAMASECAIIGSNIGGIAEQVKNDFNGFLVDPKNVEIIAEKIEFLLNNENIMAKMKKNSRKRIIEKNWTWYGYSEKITKTYAEIMD